MKRSTTKHIARFQPAAARMAALQLWGPFSGWPLLSRWIYLFALVSGGSAAAASLPVEWKHQQTFNVAGPGLVKLSLPPETLDVARPALEDLRLYDEAGAELPYLLERPSPTAKVEQNAKSFQVSLNPGATIITLETGLAQPLDGVTLETPAMTFIKSAQVEGSADGMRWQSLGQGLPIFRQANGANQLRLSFPINPWRWLRLTVDDQRSQPIPFTGARVHAAAAEPVPSEALPVRITERHENPGETRLTLNLGAANLNVATLQIETPEPLFTRAVRLAVPEVAEDSVREQTVGQGAIYRVSVENQPASSQLTLSLERQVRSRELLLFIKNQDSPLLSVTSVRAERRPVWLVFLARQAGAHHLLTGNSRCSAPQYDLGSIGSNLKSVAISTLKLSSVTDHLNYRSPEVLPGLQEDGTMLDVSGWKYRKLIKLGRAGAQQIELDLDTLAHTQPDFRDLRVLRSGKQVSYFVHRTSISRGLTPTATATNDSKNSRLSRWIIQLPLGHLPVTRLVCTARTRLFQRDLTLYEVAADDRGGEYRRYLGQESWIQIPDRATQEFTLALNSSPRSDKLILETDNGDNPPIELESFQAFYPVTRVLLKTKPEDELFLYYGNSQALAPRYDLGLVASQLLAAEKSDATLGLEEPLKKSTWGGGGTAGKGGVLFWGILGLVVAVLLLVISRLLPKSAPPS